ncbi:972_t:CDS:2 [Racocetra persica]|uniref:972_t:CDS:1 n=1 Tax=Racocetra persica TaxID=160502 RepID=A0ACA9M8F1_9GLOM|nr:972_t:CDS:2 [Racocetra persica]
MALFIKFHQLHKYTNEIIDLDNKTLSDQLEQFLVAVRKSNGQEYKASSLYTGFCVIARGISEVFEEVQVVNILDKHQFKSLHRTLDGRMKAIVEKGNKNCKQSDPLDTEEIKFILDSPATATDTPKGLLRRVWIWLSLLCCLRGGDAKRLKASWPKELDNGGMRLELPNEKNHAGEIKDPYSEAGISFIPPDTVGNKYTPVADIKKYLSKRPNDVEDDYFLLQLIHQKKFIEVNGIHSLVESGVTLDEKMIFSRHKTIAGVSAYQYQSIKRKLDNVSQLIPVEEADAYSVLKDSTSTYNNQPGFSKASDLISSTSDLLSTELNKKAKISNKKESNNQQSSIPKISSKIVII